MTPNDIIATLKKNEAALRAQGVAHAALFGSRVHGEDQPGSDIDIMVEIAPDVRMDVYSYVAITQFIEDLFPTAVDVSNRLALKPHVKPAAERDAIYAF